MAAGLILGMIVGARMHARDGWRGVWWGIGAVGLLTALDWWVAPETARRAGEATRLAFQWIVTP